MTNVNRRTEKLAYLCGYFNFRVKPYLSNNNNMQVIYLKIILFLDRITVNK